MPRRFFKPLSRQRHRFKSHWVMRPFRLVLEHPVYWSLNRRSVTRAFALGLFVAFVPAPVQMALGASTALLLRLNVPAAVAGTFITNPLTAAPIYVAAYLVGCQLLGIAAEPIHFEMSWRWLTTALVPIWRPLLLGCVVLGAATALLGYLLVGGLWHMSLVLKYHSRKDASATRNSEEGQKDRES
jgi:uncharacterized protein